MRQNIDHTVNTDFERYQESFFNKTVAEMEDPVLSPYTGHVYDRIDLVNWIAQRGEAACDPIARNKPLTEAMLVPGFLFKQETLLNIKKEQAQSDDLDRRMAAFMLPIQQQHSMDILRLSEEISGYKAELYTQRNENRTYKERIGHLEVEVGNLKSENDDFKKEVKTLRSENEEYKKRETASANDGGQWKQKYHEAHDELKVRKTAQHIWDRYGEDIDAKLAKGSTPERHEALRKYATGVKKATTREELKAAVKNIDVFHEERISHPRFFAACQLQGATTRSAIEFKENVCAHKGW